MTIPETSPLPSALVDRVRALLNRPPGRSADGAEPSDGAAHRRLLGITGAPGAGKSTVSARLAEAFGADCVVVPMDGFHLAQTTLERLGRADRKGAPDTFDAAGFVALLRRLRRPVDGETVWAPEYRREAHNAIAGALAVPADVPLVVVEGNYLLVREHGFGPVAELLDETWYVTVDDEVRLERLIARHVRFGKAPDAARTWSLGPDEANARLIAATADRADLVVDPG
ncbi:MAG: nucleoside/nucleotide kinase family protein [Cellulomonas sp. 14-74-6]|nr:MAG: nucleoside/nucleotide kinase family protein [Cellulomonas sp. 14-74-6]